MLQMNKKNRLSAAFIFIFLAVVCLFAYSPSADAKPSSHRLELEQTFRKSHGTLVLKNLKTDQVYTFNSGRSKQRFTPESSFKVANALIGLEVKAVADEYEVKRWDGIVREFPVWNRDHSLASAMRESAIWYYQAMARDIGQEQMQKYVNRIHYGNRDITGGIDTFWLNSSLKISAVEQAEFIEKLVEENLPFQKKTMKTVKRMMIDDEQDEYTIHGKTGSRLSDMGLGWYVGYVETDKGIWVFATNAAGSGAFAKQLTLTTLEKMKILN
ncbi:class D beta-lactamase [Paenibacillus lautus]|jgi:beta-lactamase class D|uniref:Beta-lactamase n=1 Tax=Paenibacillus lautus TaxID=1401 RepID=A0A385TN71_PAELA|nr:class D beta-lactamase [Paenibacillus lautus]AYB44124.1 class D beta-lactamase [Paenibacillus lautus]MCI1773077.1 class D beta-lactamase [Paenibacillus lautus]VTR48832.1 Beta-lactamase OXA-10 precursor [Actinobacillus pleuropneumoniae]